MKVCFETFGCRLNRAEALQMEAEYLAKGWERTESHVDADLFVVRGCSVTRRAEQTCQKLIAHLRRKYPNRAIRICGCLEDEQAKTPGAFLTKARVPADPVRRPTEEEPEQSAQAVPTRTARAYLKVQDGCSGRCTFCIVPKFRGASRSVPFAQVLDKARRFVDAGYREIVLTGCNLALYASENRRFPELLDALAELPARFRIGSLEPGSCASRTVDVMADHANICRFLHLPVQTASERILRAMRRPYQIAEVDALVEKAIDKMPLLGLGCDLIAGFPGEEAIDLSLTKNFLRRHPFSNAHVFPFSPRPGTVAAGLPLQVPRETRHARAHELAELASEQRAAFARRFIGKEVAVVIESEQKLTGWTAEYLACEITRRSAGPAPTRRSLVTAKVTTVKGDQLKAVL